MRKICKNKGKNVVNYERAQDDDGEEGKVFCFRTYLSIDEEFVYYYELSQTNTQNDNNFRILTLEFLKFFIFFQQVFIY